MTTYLHRYMTGGIGLSRQGKTSFEHNRTLTSRRSPLGENPYAGKGERKGEPNPFGRELEAWQARRRATAARLRRRLFLLIGGLMLLVVLLAALW